MVVPDGVCQPLHESGGPAGDRDGPFHPGYLFAAYGTVLISNQENLGGGQPGWGVLCCRIALGVGSEFVLQARLGNFVQSLDKISY